MLAEQALRGGVHGFRIERARHAPGAPDVQRKIGAVIGDAIKVVALFRGKARFKIIRHDVGREHADRMRAQMRVQAVAKPARHEMFCNVAMRDLAQRMDPGIGAAGAVHANVFAADRLHRGFQRTLHG